MRPCCLWADGLVLSCLAIWSGRLGHRYAALQDADNSVVQSWVPGQNNYVVQPLEPGYLPLAIFAGHTRARMPKGTS